MFLNRKKCIEKLKMGNNPSSIETDSKAYQDFATNYVFLRKTNDPRYGNISILEDKRTKERVALKEILCKSTADFNREIEELMHRRKVSHPNLVRLIAYTAKAEQNLCAAFYKIVLILDYFEQDFDRDLLMRETSGEYYTEEELWYIIESVLSGLDCLHKKGVAHGDLKPSNIFVTKVGSYKIAEQSLLGVVMPSYSQRLAGFDDVRAYLSPALVKNLANQELCPKHDAFKSDIFTLGLTMLHAATLTCCDQFFNWEEFVLDVETLQRRIGSLSRRYSQQFQQFIGLMLALDEKRRPSANDLLKRLPNPETHQQQCYTPNVQKTKQQVKPLQSGNATPQEGLSKGKNGGVNQNAHCKENAYRKEVTTNQFGVQVGARFPAPKQVIDPSPMKPLFESNKKNLGIAIHENYFYEMNKSPVSNLTDSRLTTDKKMFSPQSNQFPLLQSDSLQLKLESFYVDYKPNNNEVSCFEDQPKGPTSNYGKENLSPTYSSLTSLDGSLQKSTSQSNVSSQYQTSPRIEEIVEYVKKRRAGLNTTTAASSNANLSSTARENAYVTYASLTPSNASSNVYTFTSTYNSLANLQLASQKAIAMQQEANSIQPRQTDRSVKSIVSTVSRVIDNDEMNSSKVESGFMNPGALRDATNFNGTINRMNYEQFAAPRDTKIMQKTQNDSAQFYYDKENIGRPQTDKMNSGKKETFAKQQQDGFTQQLNLVQPLINSTPQQSIGVNISQPKNEEPAVIRSNNLFFIMEL